MIKIYHSFLILFYLFNNYYLNDSVAKSDGKMASDVLESAIEFLQTAAEFEIPQSKASLVLLPNILSPGKLRMVLMSIFIIYLYNTTIKERLVYIVV